MSLIEDFRMGLPDSQEMRELVARIDEFEQRIMARLDAADRLAAERHGWTLEAISRLAEINELRERLSRIEAREKPN